MTKYFIGFMLVFSAQLTVYGQVSEKIIIYSQDPHNLYATKDKDSTNLFYYKLVPKNKPIGV